MFLIYKNFDKVHLLPIEKFLSCNLPRGENFFYNNSLSFQFCNRQRIVIKDHTLSILTKLCLFFPVTGLPSLKKSSINTLGVPI